MLTIIMSIEGDSNRDFVASIYEKYSVSMKAIAFEILKNDCDAEDCVHETVLTIIKKLETFKRTNDENHLKWLVFLVCKNTALNMLKKNKRRQRNEILMTSLEPHKQDEITDDAPTPEEAVIEEDNVRFILSLINKLDEKYRKVILLKYSGLSNKDIADLLFISQNAVRQRLFLAKRKILEMGGGRFYE